MLDQISIRLALRGPLLESAIIDPADVAWQGRQFDPDGKSLWMRETILPVGEAPVARKTPEYRGIAVYDIFVPAATGTETLEAKVRELGDLYSPDDSPIEGDGVRIVVDSVAMKGLFPDGKWLFAPVHITFRAYDS